MRNQAVIFDMDGVICHTNPFHSEAFKVFFGKRGLNPTEEEFEKHMYGKSNKYIFNHFLGREIVGEEFTNLENEKEGLFREIYADNIKTIPEFLPFLQGLKKEGYRTGVATSAPRANLDLIMGHLKFSPNMESILASENVKNHKPDPEVYLTSAKLLDVNPANCLVFEDSFSGVSAAINAGMQVVGVLSSHAKEDLPPCQLYINDYSEIDLQTVDQLLQ
ncbi:HAD family hydrolase [Cyclobacterium amurskyense]|uniref:Beta-phosphoglucomutase n=1 Tax=Cyclobacterium amurskyense TaxID=320787 RepID=A0A0H4PUK3_9BACT|nr:HAD family phosphatase [Cyclobacterium amurskyense]AKP52002.1 Beta-phosphoglucomutase [Cyclobacterium amurskyense]